MARLWNGFMAARILIAAVLVIMLLTPHMLGHAAHKTALAVCLAYLALSVWTRAMGKPLRPSMGFDPQWLWAVGADVGVFAVLLFSQIGILNFTPLFALPVLLASVLGPLLLALATAACVTLVLLADSLQGMGGFGATESATRYSQAALSGAGLFAVAYLSNQLATRLTRQERAARTSAMAARAQAQVNQLVIDKLSDGVMVVDANGVVRAANPAARSMLGARENGGDRVLLSPAPPFVLASQKRWRPLTDLVNDSLGSHGALVRDVLITQEDGQRLRLQAYTQLASTPSGQARDLLADAGDTLCVVFLEDLRTLEARLRTEKLAAMGRMSAAVAHEIRNPLAAIAQANALMAEENSAPTQLHLIGLIDQNARRLARIVDDVLDVSRVRSSAPVGTEDPGGMDGSEVLDQTLLCVEGICSDWARQNGAQNRLLLDLQGPSFAVVFDEEHLRRVLVNLLDNALRYAAVKPGAIRVEYDLHAQPGGCLLTVWSDAAAIEHSLQQHLFEPFFSSESRSSGLGLYISRELCERHKALIGYRRASRDGDGPSIVEGNEFYVLMQMAQDTSDAQESERDSRFGWTHSHL